MAKTNPRTLSSPSGRRTRRHFAKPHRNPRSTRRSLVYFFSDAHLGLGDPSTERSKEATIVGFLDHVARNAQALYILGDLFDYWFEYGTVVPKGYVRLLGKLAQLSDAGISISYLTGNHDFWLKSYFTRELNIEVMREPVERLIGGRRFYLHHGDGLLRRDVGYRMLKRVLRNPVNMFLFSLLPPDVATAIARWSSRTSRAHTSSRTYESDDMTRFARRKIEEGFDFVVMGHNHAPLIRNIAGGIYVNLGDWIEACTYAVFDGTSLQLKAWHRGGSPG